MPQAVINHCVALTVCTNQKLMTDFVGVLSTQRSGRHAKDDKIALRLEGKAPSVFANR
jgi:hypothetical protein